MRGLSGRTFTEDAIHRAVISVFVVIILITAMVPGMAIAPQGASDNVSTYIVVFNDTPGIRAASDNSLTSQVESLGGIVKDRYHIINGMAITIPDSMADELQSLPNVKYVEKDQQVHVLLNDAIPQIGANLVWAEGYKGDGIKIAIIDTGVDASHPDLNNGKVIAWKDYTGDSQGVFHTTPYDDYGHGTHVSSIAAGTGNASNGKYTGVAPNANLIEAKVLDYSGSGSDSNVIAAIQWAVTNNAQVISMSLGGPHDPALDAAVDSAVQAGIPVVVAAGNSGPNSGTIGSPGDDLNAITVGAVDKSDNLASFSSRGPTTYGGYTKPDVVNVGVYIIAANASGVTHPIGTPVGGTNGFYQMMSGTSMATPMTTGVVALMLQANPNLMPAGIKKILEKTAKPLDSLQAIPNNNWGYGRVQANYAIDDAIYNSSYVSDNLPAWPATILNTTPYITVLMQNDGIHNWSMDNNVTIHALGNATGIGNNITSLPPGVNIAPGQQYNWTINLNAYIPSGIYNITYQMFVNNTPFGDTFNKTIRLNSSVNPGTLQFNNTSYSVLRTSGLAGISVNRTNGLDNTVTVNYTTANGNATAGNDYTATNGMLTFVQDKQNATFNVPILNDGIYQGNKTVQLSLNNPGGGANLGLSSANITIIDNNPQPVLQFSSASYTVLSNMTNCTIAVKRSNNLNGPVSVNYTVGGGNATPGTDYVPATGTLNLGNGESSKSFNVTINGSNSFSNKTVNLTLSGFTNGSIPGSNISAVLTIITSQFQYTYELEPGWNLISVPLNVSDNEIDHFFPASMMSEIWDVWGWNASAQKWTYYSPDPNTPYKGYEPIVTMDAGKAYWLNMNSNASFTIQGAVPAGAPNSTIQLVSNWNFVGLNGMNPSTPDVMYPAAWDVWGWNATKQTWTYYSPDPNSPFQSFVHITTIQPGQGLWVNM